MPRCNTMRIESESGAAKYGLYRQIAEVIRVPRVQRE
jgi:hypothetical protein